MMWLTLVVFIGLAIGGYHAVNALSAKSVSYHAMIEPTFWLVTVLYLWHLIFKRGGP